MQAKMDGEQKINPARTRCPGRKYSIQAYHCAVYDPCAVL